MSFVFLAGERAYKLKKPVRYPFLDFSTLEARERDCREEVRLNRRLAKGVYLGLAWLSVERCGLALGGNGVIVDWLVEMRRLPREKMFDRAVIGGGASDAQLDAICDVLAEFYKRADRSSMSAESYVARFFEEQALNRDILTRGDFALDHGRATLVLDALDARLVADRPLLEERIRSRSIVDGHGDLRPEHICLTEPVAIFDCLEFNAGLRQVDPFDELALLGVECAQLGAPALLRKFVEKVAFRLGCAPPWRLLGLYAAWRAVLRARLSIAHLLDVAPREPAKWEPLASSYLDIAQRALTSPEGVATIDQP
jgi:aminoglycoside phosphotransferase family enzyme